MNGVRKTVLECKEEKFECVFIVFESSAFLLRIISYVSSRAS